MASDPPRITEAVCRFEPTHNDANFDVAGDVVLLLAVPLQLYYNISGLTPGEHAWCVEARMYVLRKWSLYMFVETWRRSSHVYSSKVVIVYICCDMVRRSSHVYIPEVNIVYIC